jgi:hypothetical protein
MALGPWFSAVTPNTAFVREQYPAWVFTRVLAEGHSSIGIVSLALNHPLGEFTSEVPPECQHLPATDENFSMIQSLAESANENFANPLQSPTSSKSATNG